jgi:hypothetical protein
MDKKESETSTNKVRLNTAGVASLGPILVSQPSSSYPHASHIEPSEKDEASKTWYWVSCIELLEGLHSQLSCMPEIGA